MAFAGAQAERDSGVEEVALVRGEAKRWEARVNELLLKYSSVDLAEYTRVTEKLKVPPLPGLSTPDLCDPPCAHAIAQQFWLLSQRSSSSGALIHHPHYCTIFPTLQNA